MKDKLLYGFVGMVFGMVVLGAVMSGPLSHVVNKSRESMHQLSDGSMMSTHEIASDTQGIMRGMGNNLAGKTGDVFDHEFLAEMIIHHKGAVDMAQLVLSTTKRPELVQLAKDIIAAQTKEIDMMKGWEKAWFK